MAGYSRSLFALVSAALLFFTPTNAAKTLNLTFAENPPSNSANHIVQDNFLGVSFELYYFDQLWGSTVDSMPSAMQNYLHNLNARISNPLRIRVGGNAMDGSTYVPDMSDTMLNETDPDAYFNDVPLDFGPVLFDVMKQMSDNVGPFQYLIGLSMRDPENHANVLELALQAEASLGDLLDGMLLGNEPDLYAGHGERDTYEIKDYIPEIQSVVNDFKENGLLDKPLIGGPTVCCSWDLDEVIDAGMGDLDYKYYTLQHYPNHACQGENEKNTNITYYLTHNNLNEYINWNEKGIEAAIKSDTPVLLTEYNSVACGGSNISSTFATALWGIDVALKSAAQNFSGAYMHTREYGVKYNLFEPTTDGDSLSVDWRTGAIYYGALFVSEAIDSEGSIVVDLDVDKSNTNPASTVAGYAIYDKGGKERGKFALINYAREGANPQKFRIPANLATTIEYRILTAPTVEETTEITWGGQTVRYNGQLEGEQSGQTMDCADGCVIEVPSPGAALVLVGGEAQFYYGNSTLASWPGMEGDGALSSRSLGGMMTFAVAAVLGSYLL